MVGSVQTSEMLSDRCKSHDFARNVYIKRLPRRQGSEPRALQFLPLAHQMLLWDFYSSKDYRLKYRVYMYINPRVAVLLPRFFPARLSRAGILNIPHRPCHRLSDHLPSPSSTVTPTRHTHSGILSFTILPPSFFFLAPSKK